MLALVDVCSHILATIALLTHVAWTQIVICNSGFKKKRRDKITTLIQKTYGSIAIITGVVNSAVNFLLENSDAITAAKILFNLLVVFAHLFAVRLMVNFIKSEREIKTKAVTNSQQIYHPPKGESKRTPSGVFLCE